MSKFEVIEEILENAKKIEDTNNKLENNAHLDIELKECLTGLKQLRDEVSTQSFDLMKLNQSSATIEAICKALETTMSKTMSLLCEMPSAQILESVSNTLSSSFAEAARNTLTNFSAAFLETIKSPFLQWIKDLDISPWMRIFDNWKIPNFSYDHSDLYENYHRAMYEAKWFPYAIWMSEIGLFVEISDVLDSSRGMSKRCEKRIDKAILSYYTKSEIKEIKKRWNATELDTHIKKALGQTLEAYLRGEYALVIPFLATMWEGIIKSKTVEDIKKPKDNFKKLVDDNGFDEAFSDFYNNFIIGTCYSKDEVIDGVPNRHSVAHSWYIKYPTKKAALNSILLTDFMLNLKPSSKNKSKST